ncbi:hypothetical protein [Archangium sp.]|uniref:hypothetical protein n=1 Tax=Archangium sp. TaxID=1872627 RepID=UPI002ED875DB
MNLHPTATELGDFAFDVLERLGPNEWLALVVSEDQMGQVVGALMEELRAIGDIEPVHIQARTAQSLVEAVRKQKVGVLIISGLNDFSPLDWQHLDEERSVLQRENASIFILDESALGQFFRHAPNLASWLGGAAWRLETRSHLLSAREREARLSGLRNGYGMTDAEVIARAEQGTLPGDPPYAEWLVLLGRGDLLGK